MIPPEGIRFRPPSENHTAPLGTKPSATPPEEQGFTDRALDAYTLQELLDLRARIERRLPARSLKDLDLERVHIATDCLRVVREIEAPKNLGGHCMVFHEIKERSNLFRACLFSHE